MLLKEFFSLNICILSKKCILLLNKTTLNAQYIDFFYIFLHTKFATMDKHKILYVSLQISPYTGETKMGEIASILPQKTQESGNDIRMFLPRFGTINERRHQLHEVIRLSGMNLIIDDFDHQPLLR